MQYSFPWNHFIFDNFLPAEDLARVQGLLKNQTEGFLKEEDDELQINYKFLPDLELAKYFLSPSFKSFLESTSGLRLTLNPQSLIQMRRMTPESPYFPVHIDTQEIKSLVCLLYLSPEWTAGCGGELILHQEKSSDPAGPFSKILEPRANRMILFRSEDCHWHSVNKVHNWLRYSIIMEWFIS